MFPVAEGTRNVDLPLKTLSWRGYQIDAGIFRTAEAGAKLQAKCSIDSCTDPPLHAEWANTLLFGIAEQVR